MAKSNGGNGAVSVDDAAPSDFVDWKVAGKSYLVPCLTLWHYDHPEIKDAIDGLQFTTRIEYAKLCHGLLSQILHAEGNEAPDIKVVLKEQPLFGPLPISELVNELFVKSGYAVPPGEATAASPGIGTSTGSSPALSPAVSAEGTGIASAELSP